MPVGVLSLLERAVTAAFLKRQAERRMPLYV
jgi:hypothetical protein